MGINVERIETRIAEARNRIEEIGPEIEELDAQTGEVAAAEHVDEVQLGKLTDQRHCHINRNISQLGQLGAKVRSRRRRFAKPRTMRFEAPSTSVV